MPAHEISFNHSRMPSGYKGKAIKYANTEKAAAELIGKYSAKDKTIIDKRGNVLSNVEIKQHESKD